jgi:hypothetical protein
MRTRAKGKIGRWSRVRAGAQRKAILARRVAAIDMNAANELQHRRTDMTRSEIAAFATHVGKPNVMTRDGLRVIAHGQPIALAVERISRKRKYSSGGHADTGPWEN